MHSIRKPRVFLSHSKKDVEFIRKLDLDLRTAQCDPWLDEIELRSGQPWLDQIFSSGIPSCEIVLCYITANSIESAVFKQEMDARLLERLQNARVSLLLYVASPDLRSKLRLDIQRLQMPELNGGNYVELFPRIVAEIWRSYAESVVLSAVEAERVKRLEAELRIKELESNATATVFTASENAEFTIIWSRLDRKVQATAEVRRKANAQTASGKSEEAPETSAARKVANYSFVLDAGHLFRVCVLSQKFQPSSYEVNDRIRRDALLHLGLNTSEFDASIDMPLDVDEALLRYGFVQRQYAPSNASDQIVLMMQDPFKLMFTSKFDRFGFWIEHNFGASEPLVSVVVPQ